MKPLPSLFFSAAALASISALEATATEQVQVDYMLNCQGCHLPGGEGMPARGVPNAKGFLGSFLTVPGGREFLIRVPGAALSDLSDDRLAAVVNWMLMNFSPDEVPVDFVPYTGSEVAALRASPLVDVSGARAALVRRLDELELVESSL